MGKSAFRGPLPSRRPPLQNRRRRDVLKVHCTDKETMVVGSNLGYERRPTKAPPKTQHNTIKKADWCVAIEEKKCIF